MRSQNYSFLLLSAINLNGLPKTGNQLNGQNKGRFYKKSDPVN
ncbi:MAG: hypothetical protein WCP08_01190 [Prolixibacteraceae bacterium]